MNKLLLSTLSVLLLLVNGGHGLQEERRNEIHPEPVSNTQPKPPQTEAFLTVESGGIGFQKRDKRIPDSKSIDSNSFGYTWNNGNGVSYLRMHIDGHRSGGSDSFGGGRHQEQDFNWNIGHHKAGPEEVNKGRLHENHFKANKGEINLEKLKLFSHDNSFTNLGIRVPDKIKKSLIQPSRDPNPQSKFRAGINIQSAKIGYDQNQNYEHLNLGFGLQGSDINEKSNFSSNALDFGPSHENTLKKTNREIEGQEFYGQGTKGYVRQTSSSDEHGLSSPKEIEIPGYDFSPFFSQIDLFNGANINQNAFSEHSRGVGADKTITNTNNVEGGSGHELKLGSEANLYGTQGVNDPEEFNNYGLQNYAANGYGILSQNDIHIAKQTDITEPKLVPDVKYQEHGDRFIPQFWEGYHEGPLEWNGMANLGHFPFLGSNQNNYNRFKKHSLSANGGRINRKQQGKDVIDSHLIGPAIYDIIDRNRGNDLVPQGSSTQIIGTYNAKDVSCVDTGELQFQNRPQNHVSKREESKEQGLTRDQELKKKNKLQSTDANGYSCTTLGQGVLPKNKPMRKGPTFPDKNELLKSNLLVPGKKVNHGDRVLSGRTESMRHISAQSKENLNPTPVHSYEGNEGKINPEEQLLNANNTSKYIQNDDRKGREIKSVQNLNQKVEKDTGFIHTRDNTDHLFADSTITQNNYGTDHESEQNLFEKEIGHKNQDNYEYLWPRPYYLYNKPEMRHVTKAIPVHKELRIPVPHPIRQPILIPVPVRMLEPYYIQIPFPVTVEKTVEVPVEKVIPYPVEKPVPVKVYKKVNVPVPKPYPVKVPMYKVKYIHHTVKKHQ